MSWSMGPRCMGFSNCVQSGPWAWATRGGSGESRGWHPAPPPLDARPGPGHTAPRSSAAPGGHSAGHRTALTGHTLGRVAPPWTLLQHPTRSNIITQVTSGPLCLYCSLSRLRGRHTQGACGLCAGLTPWGLTHRSGPHTRSWTPAAVNTQESAGGRELLHQGLQGNGDSHRL